jgi:hypothetical protein
MRYENAARVVDQMDDATLSATWDALLLNPDAETLDDYNGVDYPTWCELVYSELDRRNLSRPVVGKKR